LFYIECVLSKADGLDALARELEECSYMNVMLYSNIEALAREPDVCSLENVFSTVSLENVFCILLPWLDAALARELLASSKYDLKKQNRLPT